MRSRGVFPQGDGDTRREFADGIAKRSRGASAPMQTATTRLMAVAAIGVLYCVAFLRTDCVLLAKTALNATCYFLRSRYEALTVALMVISGT